jgi:hypothetical protein
VGRRGFIAMPYGIDLSPFGTGFNLAWVETVAQAHAEYRVRCAGRDDSVTIGRTPTGGRPRISGDVIVYRDEPALTLRAAHACGAAPQPIAVPNTRATIVDVEGDILVRSEDGVLATILGTGRTLVLSNGYVDRANPRAVPLGAHYLATWRENGTRAMYGRFTVNGKLLDGAGERLGSGDRVESAPAIAGDGNRALIAWHDLAALHVAFASADGTIDEIFTSAATTANPMQPAVHWNGEQYAVFWHQGFGLHGMRFDRDGHALDPAPRLLVDAWFLAPVVAWTGSSYVVNGFVQSSVCQPVCSMFAVSYAVSPDLGVVTGVGGFLLLRNVRQYHAADGTAGALVAWSEQNAVRATITDANGVAGPAFVIPGATYVSDIVTTADGWTILAGPDVWHVSRGGVVGERIAAYPYVPAGSESILVTGKAIPLLIYRTTSGEAAELLGHFVTPPRRRVIR